MTRPKNPRLGSSFGDFLEEQGLRGEAEAHAIKRVIAWQIEQAMKEQGLTKVEMARRMRTSRAHLDRLLDPENDRVQLDTVQRAAAAVGKRLRLELA
ncbi:MAG TPA: Fis family transcriptional regulator [Acetobacteraceae bacterium]|nr:Fis family transcriptional regulator [Acetobacteraceae bacterium]